jgi:uncharacterized membrane protein
LANNSGLGLSKNSAAALAVLLSPTIVAPLAIFILERDSYVRFYALQAMIGVVAFVALTSGLNILSFATVLRAFIGLANGFLFLIGFVLWLMMVYKSWQGIEWEIPILGRIARQLIGRI